MRQTPHDVRPAFLCDVPGGIRATGKVQSMPPEPLLSPRHQHVERLAAPRDLLPGLELGGDGTDDRSG